MCFQLSITISIFIANLFNYYFAKILNGQGWHLNLRLDLVPTAIFIVGALCLPNSLNSIIKHGKNDEARVELEKIHGTPDFGVEYKDIITTSDA